MIVVPAQRSCLFPVSALVCALTAGCGGGGGATTGSLLVRDTARVRVGVVDSGFVVEHPQYSALVEDFRVFSDGTSAGTNTTSIRDTEDPHGTYVVQTIAGKAVGLVDGARELSLLLAKATPINTNPTPGPSDYWIATRDIHAGTVWAIDRGAKVMNYSLGPLYLLDGYLRKSFDYAVSHNVAVVIAAGNESLSLTQHAQSLGSASSLFSYADLRNNTLVVGAVQRSGGDLVRAPYSNYAGSDVAIQSRFLVAQAPVSLRSQFPTGDSYTNWLATGTSFTAPQVTAALASLLTRWPHLSAASSTQILLDTADQTFSSLYAQKNCGEAGVGSGTTNCGLFYFGQGILDMDAALNPIGATHIATGSTVNSGMTSVGGTSFALAPAFGDGAAQLRLSSALFDSYGRDYSFNLASRMQASASFSNSQNWVARLGETRQAKEDGAARFQFAHAGHGGLLAADGRWSLDGGHALHWQRATGRHYQDHASTYPWLSLAGQDALSSYDWIDEFGVSRPLSNSARLYAGWSRASFDNATALANEPTTSDTSAIRQKLQLSWGQPLETRLIVGWAHTQELGAALGGQGAGALALNRSFGQSAFAQFERPLNGGWQVFGQVELGEMTVKGEGLLQGITGVGTSRWAAGFAHKTQAHRWGLVMSQPLRVERAEAVFDLPVGRTLDGRVLREARSVDLTPTGRQVNFELALERQRSPGNLQDSAGLFGLHLIYAHDAGHVRNAKDWAVLGSYRLRW